MGELITNTYISHQLRSVYPSHHHLSFPKCTSVLIPKITQSVSENSKYLKICESQDLVEHFGRMAWLVILVGVMRIANSNKIKDPLA